ncbi:RluA family pseudouridine synthase [Breznakiella homolactica]|uniref:RluA family pseudouridine synthase n=1 Tax=Breznakiella homolactica TaxID=2798577 RepID=A0A7T7XKB9_9SPIR|nr:RluA family pseudouridine synthase [Breznakiella homolactica]QQO07946.1 RluA family pseudouridine synthase [Breznakiella homolactica]
MIQYSMELTLTAGSDDDGRRLDRILRKALKDLPLSAVHRLLRMKHVLVNGKPAAGEYRVNAGDTITILGVSGNFSRPPQAAPEAAARGTAGDVPEVLFEGSGLLALNKPRGIPVHGENSLDTRVQAYLGPKIPPSLSFKPGPLHRLDTPTSGIIVFSADIEGARYFSDRLRKGAIEKFYIALADGELRENQIWKDELHRDRQTRVTSLATEGGGRYAETRVIPLAADRSHSLLLLKLGTGRTHQIRAQSAGHGHPLTGDHKYGGSPQQGGLLLHAFALRFPEDRPREIPETLTAPLPDYFLRRIGELFGNMGDIFGKTRDFPLP